VGSKVVSLVVIAIYFIDLMAIGVWTSRKVKTSEGMLVAGRDLGFWVFVLLVVSSICSGMTILGVSGLGV
jgi:sodium/proline symporter